MASQGPALPCSSSSQRARLEEASRREPREKRSGLETLEGPFQAGTAECPVSAAPLQGAWDPAPGGEGVGGSDLFGEVSGEFSLLQFPFTSACSVPDASSSEPQAPARERSPRFWQGITGPSFLAPEAGSAPSRY